MKKLTKNRILIIGSSSTNMFLGITLAKEHPEIDFDIVCSKEFESPVPNLHVRNHKLYITLPLDTDNLDSPENVNESTINGLTNELLEIIETADTEYDFIVAFSLDFQRWGKLVQLRGREKLNIPILCPSASVAELENSKLLTKEILNDIGIPTPSYRILDKNNLIEELDQCEFPIVLKMDYLFSWLGFGAWVFKGYEYRQIIPKLAERASIHQSYYVEEFVQGKEVSVHFLCNGYSCEYMGAARDYKKLNDGDRGMNTAGLGSYSPVDYFTDKIKNTVCEYADRLLSHLNSLGIFYHGFLYLGIMIDTEGVPQVLEINTRPGNPEFLTILNTIDHTNLLENLISSATGDTLTPFKSNNNYCGAVCIHHSDYDSVLKYKSEIPTFNDVPKDIEYIPSSLWFSKFNIRGFLLATAMTRTEASDKIYSYLFDKDLKDFTTRKDIGYLE